MQIVIEMEMHDSIIDNITLSDAELVVNFERAFLNFTDKNLGVLENEDRWVTGVIKIFSPKYVQSPETGVIWDGSLKIDGKDYYNLIPVNFQASKPCLLSFSNESGNFEISGLGVSVDLDLSLLPSELKR